MGDKMNNRGFTTVELILTMVVVITIMATITSVTYTYRDKSRYEAIVTEITNYKNNITKIIYDDILDKDNKIVALKQDNINEKKFYLVDENDNYVKTLQIINENNKVGINYDGIDYLLTDTEYEDFNIYSSKSTDNTEFYKLDIYFKNKYLENKFKIHFVIS